MAFRRRGGRGRRRSFGSRRPRRRMARGRRVMRRSMGPLRIGFRM